MNEKELLDKFAKSLNRKHWDEYENEKFNGKSDSEWVTIQNLSLKKLAKIAVAEHKREMEELNKWINEQKKLITGDERFNYPCANVQVNAPLALIQSSMESRLQTLNDFESFIKARLCEKKEGVSK